MSVSVPSNTNSIFSLLNQVGKTNSSNPSAANQANGSGTGSFLESFALFVADFQAQTLGSLTSSTLGADDAGSSTSIGALLASLNASTGTQNSIAASGGVAGLAATGRNSALFDPESAYKMMSVINSEDVAYKAQFSELNQMKSYLAALQQDAQSLTGIDASTGNDSIKTQLQAFAGQYNDWIQRFDADMQSGGILANTRAAQVSRYELDQSVGNVFNGAMDGLHGLRDLGFSIDPTTRLATLDTAKLDSVLSSNKQGAVDTLREFSANFAKSAELLDSAGNFIPNQIDNLGRVIHYVADNKSSLQAEFGLGDTAAPSGAVAQALAAYNRTYGS